MNPVVLSAQQSVLPITFLASFLIWVMFFGLLVLWIIDGEIKQEQALHAAIAVILAWVVTEMFKSFFPTPRPFMQNGDLVLTLTLYHENGSFPSTHAAVAFALATTVYLHNKKLGILFLAGAFLVGVGRVMGNVHYPIDVLGGVLIGVLVAYAISKIHVYNLLPSRLKKKVDN